jgi:hypothetical protein
VSSDDWSRAVAHYRAGETDAAWRIAVRRVGGGEPHWRRLTDMCLRRFAGLEHGEPMPEHLIVLDSDFD